MLPCQIAIRFDRVPEDSTLDDTPGTRLAVGAVQVGLAIVFVPAMLAILVGVGVYMVFEWAYLRAGVAIDSRGGPLASSPGPWERRPSMTTTR